MTTDKCGFTCPVPDSGDGDRITLAHGEGGRLMRRLIRDSVLPQVENPYLSALGDAACLPPCNGPLAMTSDSFVVAPLFFPGGDIGSMSVYGTVNDLAVSGAKPLWLSLALIIEEGLPVELFRRVLQSIGDAARQVDVKIVTGDTKVVPRGAADQLFINTSGVGEIVYPIAGPGQLTVGDTILVSGPIGRHGMAVMTSREGLEFDPAPTSDSGSLVEAVEALRSASLPVRALRDATRGGLAAVLHEWAQASGQTMAVDEQNLPVTPEVRGACEVLGLDPLHVANEGTMVLAVPADREQETLEVLRRVAACTGATRVGEVQSKSLAPVIVRRVFGQEIPLDEPLGAPLPRIC